MKMISKSMALVLVLVILLSSAMTTNATAYVLQPGEVATITIEYSNARAIEGTVTVSNPTIVEKVEYSYSMIGLAVDGTKEGKDGKFFLYASDAAGQSGTVTLKIYLTADAPRRSSCTVNINYAVTAAGSDTPGTVQKVQHTISVAEAAPVDVSGLQAQLLRVETLVQWDYTKESWSTMKEAGMIAAYNLSSDDQAAVDTAAANLKKAIDNLVPMDYSKLQEALSQAANGENLGEVSESWTQFVTDLTYACQQMTSGDQNAVADAVTKLQSSQNALSSLLADILSQRDTLQQELDASNAALEEANTALSEKDAALAAKDEELAKLQEKITALQKRIEELQALIDGSSDLATEYNKLLDQLDAVNGELETIKADLEAALAQRDEAIAERDAALAELEELKASWQKATEELEAIKQERNAALEEVEKAQADHQKTLDALKDAEEEQSKAKAELDAALEKLKNALADLENAPEDQEGAVAALKEALENLEKAMAEREKALAEQDKLRKQLEESQKALEQALADLKAALEKENEVVIVEKEVEVEPTYTFCNNPSHTVIFILLIISLVLNAFLITLMVVYLVKKRRKQRDDTPLVDYDIDDDATGVNEDMLE